MLHVDYKPDIASGDGPQPVCKATNGHHNLGRDADPLIADSYG